MAPAGFPGAEGLVACTVDSVIGVRLVESATRATSLPSRRVRRHLRPERRVKPCSGRLATEYACRVSRGRSAASHPCPNALRHPRVRFPALAGRSPVQAVFPASVHKPEPAPTVPDHRRKAGRPPPATALGFPPSLHVSEYNLIHWLSDPTFWTALLQIVAIDILPGGDNAVVIAPPAGTCRRTGASRRSSAASPAPS